MPTTVEGAAHWNEVVQRLTLGLRPDDMAVFPLARRRSAAWSPEQNRLFELVAARYPALNLLAVYPALSTGEGVSSAVVDRTLIAVVPTEDREADPAGSVEEALRRMVRSVPSWTPQQKDAAHGLLARSAHEHAVEWLQGRVLVHAHSEDVDTTTILIGTGAWPWALAGCAAPTRLIVALVGSRDQSPGSHLRVLAALARCLHDRGVRERLDAELSAAEIASALGDYLAALEK